MSDWAVRYYIFDRRSHDLFINFRHEHPTRSVDPCTLGCTADGGGGSCWGVISMHCRQGQVPQQNISCAGLYWIDSSTCMCCPLSPRTWSNIWNAQVKYLFVGATLDLLLLQTGQYSANYITPLKMKESLRLWLVGHTSLTGWIALAPGWKWQRPESIWWWCNDEVQEHSAVHERYWRANADVGFNRWLE